MASWIWPRPRLAAAVPDLAYDGETLFVELDGSPYVAQVAVCETQVAESAGLTASIANLTCDGEMFLQALQGGP